MDVSDLDYELVGPHIGVEEETTGQRHRRVFYKLCRQALSARWDQDAGRNQQTKDAGMRLAKSCASAAFWCVVCSQRYL